MTSSLPKEAWLWMDYIGDIDGHWVRWTSQNDKVPHSGVAKYVRADFVPRIKPLEWGKRQYVDRKSLPVRSDKGFGWVLSTKTHSCISIYNARCAVKVVEGMHSITAL